MLASTIQFTTNPPTPGSHHPHKAAEHGPGNQGALPQNPDSMPPPHTQGHPPPPNRQQRACPLCQHQTSQPPARTNPRDTVGRPAFREEQTPAGPDPYNGPDNQRPGSHPHNQSLERR